MWRLFAERDDAAMVELRRKVRRQLRAGRSGDAIIAEIVRDDPRAAACIAVEILADPTTANTLIDKLRAQGEIRLPEPLTEAPDESYPFDRAMRAREAAWRWVATPDRAAQFLLEAVAPDQPDLPALLAMARKLAEATGDWPLLGRVATAASSSDEEDRALAAAAVEEARAAMPILPSPSALGEGSVEACRRAIAADPKSRAPRRELAQLLRKGERWRVLVEALREEEATACATPAERAAVLREIVVVCRDQLKHELLVTSSLSELSQLAPDDESAMEQLAALHVQHRRWTELVTILNRRAARVAEAGGAGDAEELAALHLRIARVQLDQLGNEVEAIKHLERVLDAAPDARAMEMLDALYTKRREWEKLVGLGRRRLAETTEPNARRERALELARLSERAKKPGLSIECWVEVLALGPDEPEALSALEKLYERERRWSELAEICQKQAETAGDAARQAAAWQKLGQLYGERLDDNERAIVAWRRLLSVQPDSARAQEALKKLFIARRSWDELEALFGNRAEEYLRAIERQSEVESGAAQLELLRRVATLYRDRLRRPDRALRAFEKMLELDGKNGAAAEGLIALYGAADGVKLARVLSVQLEHTSDPALRQERLQKLAELHEQSLNDPKSAFAWRLRAFEENPAGARQELERLAALTGEWRALVDGYRAAVGRVPPLPLWRVVARAEEEKLGDVEAAVQSWRRILDADFHNEEALDALERLYTGRDQHAELVTICQRRLEMAPDRDARGRAFLKIAQLAELRLSDDALAIKTYELLLADDPRERSALSALDRLYRKSGQWKVLGEVLERQLALAPEDDQLRLDLAALRETSVNDLAGAIALYRQVLDRDPASAAARGALERHLHGELQHEAATILLPIYERAGQWAQLAEAHEVLSQRATGERLIDLLRTLGKIREEKLKDARGALNAYTRALKAAPSETELYTRLENLAEPLSAWNELVALYREIASKPQALSVQIDLRCRLGRLYRDRLGETERALATFQRVADLDAKNLTALAALEDLYGQTNRRVELAELLRRRLSMVDSLDERVRVAKRLVAALGGDDETLRALESELSARPDDPARLRGLAELLSARAAADPKAPTDRAIQLWEKLALTGEARAFDALAELHEAAGRYSDAAAVLARRAPSAESLARLYRLRGERLHDEAGARATLALAVEEGALSSSSLSVNERAGLALDWARLDVDDEERWRRVNELAPANEEGSSALERICRREEKWHDVIELLRARMSRRTESAQRMALWLDIDRIYEENIGDADKAYGALCAAYREEPDDDALGAELERRATNAARWQEALRELLRVAERRETENPSNAADRWVQIARIYDVELNSLDEAALILRNVLSTHPDHLAALDQLAGLHQKRGAWGDMAPLLRHRAELEKDRSLRAALFLSVADLLEVQENDVVGAISAYQGVLEAEPTNGQALYSLEALYRRAEMWAELIELLVTRAQTTSDAAQKVAWLLQLGQVWDEKMGDGVEAAIAFRQVLDVDPMSIDALEGLERLYRAAGDLEGELAILDHEMQLWPDHADYVYEKREAALRQAGAWAELAETYSEHVLTVDDHARRGELRHALAEVCELELKDLARAKEALDAILAESPDDSRARDGLARLSASG